MLTAKENELLSKVADQRETVIEIAKKLIEVPTINPPGREYLRIVEVLQRWCEGWGLKVETYDVPEVEVLRRSRESEGFPRRILVARLVGRAERPELHFNGHYDVVPATGEWKVCDPFTSIIKNGRLYGRGATDMKGGIASILTALSVLKDYVSDFEGSLSFSATPDEEVGGAAGVGFMVEHSMVKPDLCIIGEASGKSNIWDSHKGQVWLEVTVKGRASHGANPWLGVNAFERASYLASCLFKEYLPRLAQRRSRRSTIPPEANVSTAMIGGVVKGGVKINVVPDFITFTIDRRLIPEEDVNSTKKELEEAITRCAEENGIPMEDVKVNFIHSYEACIPADSALSKSLAEVIEDVTRVKPSVTLCNAGLDMRFFVDAGIPTVTYGPGVLGQAHVVDEYVEVDDLVDVAGIYAVYAYRMLTKAGFSR